MEGAVTITDLTWVKRGSGPLVARESARNAAPFAQPGVNINIGFKPIENHFKITVGLPFIRTTLEIMQLELKLSKFNWKYSCLSQTASEITSGILLFEPIESHWTASWVTPRLKK